MNNPIFNLCQISIMPLGYMYLCHTYERKIIALCVLYNDDKENRVIDRRTLLSFEIQARYEGGDIAGIKTLR